MRVFHFVSKENEVSPLTFYLNSRQNLVNQFRPPVLVLHLNNLKFSGFGSYEGIGGDH